jgi:putative tricarboxylic transport membrane protein
MLAMGILGLVLERFRIPLGPVVLGIILGGPLEHRFIQCLMKSPSAAPFFEGVVSPILFAICVLLWSRHAIAWGFAKFRRTTRR